MRQQGCLIGQPRSKRRFIDISTLLYLLTRCLAQFVLKLFDQLDRSRIDAVQDT